MPTFLVPVCLCVVSLSLGLSAQTAVPAEKFSWQPTPEVRSFARGACSAMAGVTPPSSAPRGGGPGALGKLGN